MCICSIHSMCMCVCVCYNLSIADGLKKAINIYELTLFVQNELQLQFRFNFDWRENCLNSVYSIAYTIFNHRRKQKGRWHTLKHTDTHTHTHSDTQETDEEK